MMAKARMNPNGDEAWTAAAMGTAPARPAAPVARVPRIPVAQEPGIPVSLSAGTTVQRAGRGQVQKVAAYLPPDLGARLREHCHQSGKSISDVVTEALEAHLYQQGR
jgi:hypothetical protein